MKSRISFGEAIIKPLKLVMNGQHDEFNRAGLGNQLLMARQGLANVPLRLPQADLDKSKPMPRKEPPGSGVVTPEG
jgi:hypothetical protein